MKQQHQRLEDSSDLDPDALERDDAIIGVALRWSLAGFLLLAAVIGAAAYAFRPAPTPQPVHETALAEVKVRAVPEGAIPVVPFTDITQQAGIQFHHANAATGRKLLPETMGGGCAFFDFDNDGDQDLLFVNSLARWPWDEPAISDFGFRISDSRSNNPQSVIRNPKSATMALHRNDGWGNFEDATAGSGLDVALFGMGAAVGDYDNDGRVDVFLSALGTNRLFHNEGDGKFRDVTDACGVAGQDDAWSTCCGWFDFDNDGDLDLFVGNYVQWSREYDEGQNFQLTGGGRAYGRPQNFEGTFPYLYRNDGDGRFTEIAEQAGLHVRNPNTGVPLAKSLGVTFADADLDGHIDILVANDTVQNFLFHNQGDGTFREIAAQSGIAFDMNGNARGAMGIDVARLRPDHVLGIAIGNFANEMTALYVSYGNDMQFMDEAISTGLGPSTRTSLTFGLFYFDYDLDGRLDLLTANGHLEEDINRVQPSQHYEQPPHLFWNAGPEADTEYLPVTEKESGPDFFKPLVGRGASYADIDGDGDLDVLVTATGQPPRLLRNELHAGRNLGAGPSALGAGLSELGAGLQGELSAGLPTPPGVVRGSPDPAPENDHHWLRFKLTGTKSNRDAIGARIELELEGRTLRRQVMPSRSYLSQVELPVTFGLGRDDKVHRATVHWPSGAQQEIELPEVDRLIEVVEP